MELIKVGLLINVFVMLALLIIMEFVNYAHWDHNLVLILVNVFVLAIKNGFQLLSHVFNAKPMLPHPLTNFHVSAIMDGLTTIMMVFVMPSVGLTKFGQ